MKYSRYKTQGWFNDSLRHSLAAKGVKTSYAGLLASARKRRAAIAKRTIDAPASLKRTRGGKISGIGYFPLTKAEKEKVGAKKFEATFQPREERRNFIRATIREYMPPKDGMTYIQYLDNLQKYLQDSNVELDAKINDVKSHMTDDGYVAEKEEGTVWGELLGTTQRIYFGLNTEQDMRNATFRGLMNTKFDSKKGKFV